MRSLMRVGLVLAAMAAAQWLVPAGGAAFADLIPSAPVTEGLAPEVGGTNAVAERLRAVGMDDSEVSGRLAELRPEDVQALAQNPEQVQCAGSTGVILLIVGGVILLAVILYLIVSEPM